MLRGRAAAWIAVAALAVTGALASAPAPAQAGELRPGIDISNHQDRIAWGKVARSGEQFAFAKATEGTSFVDAYYKRNRRGASKRGLRFGAYHFARPSGGSKQGRRKDARKEAKLFMAVAKPRPGHLLPVLDLEVSDGLGVSELQQWTRTWLRVVEKHLGVKAMIYTSPLFWRSAMGDTTWFADHGHKALWIAHWEVSRPLVPADNWGGEGWTFWQYTPCGSVPGVAGCVDRNRYGGRSFRPVTIPRRGAPEPLPEIPELPELPDLPDLRDLSQPGR